MKNFRVGLFVIGLAASACSGNESFQEGLYVSDDPAAAIPAVALRDGLTSADLGYLDNSITESDSVLFFVGRSNCFPGAADAATYVNLTSTKIDDPAIQVFMPVLHGDSNVTGILNERGTACALAHELEQSGKNIRTEVFGNSDIPMAESGSFEDSKRPGYMKQSGSVRPATAEEFLNVMRSIRGSGAQMPGADEFARFCLNVTGQGC